MDNEDKGTTLVVPSFRLCSELQLNRVSFEIAMSRMKEVQHLVPANYSSLEYAFQESWRECKNNAIQVGSEIRKAKQNIEEIKSDIILDEIPQMLEELPKSANNADFRKAVMNKNVDYKNSLEHLGKLDALLEHFESNMKTMENTSRFLKKQMDYIIRQGRG